MALSDRVNCSLPHFLGRCIRIEPTNATPMFFRARCFHKTGDLKAALSDFDATVKRVRVCAPVLFRRLSPRVTALW